MSIVATLLGEIEVFCRQAEISESVFGRRAVNDSKFVARLREGKGITVATVESVHGYIEDRRQQMGLPAGPPLRLTDSPKSRKAGSTKARAA